MVMQCSLIYHGTDNSGENGTVRYFFDLKLELH